MNSFPDTSGAEAGMATTSVSAPTLSRLPDEILLTVIASIPFDLRSLHSLSRSNRRCHFLMKNAKQSIILSIAKGQFPIGYIISIRYYQKPSILWLCNLETWHKYIINAIATCHRHNTRQLTSAMDNHVLQQRLEVGFYLITRGRNYHSSFADCLPELSSLSQSLVLAMCDAYAVLADAVCQSHGREISRQYHCFEATQWRLERCKDYPTRVWREAAWLFASHSAVGRLLKYIDNEDEDREAISSSNMFQMCMIVMKHNPCKDLSEGQVYQGGPHDGLSGCCLRDRVRECLSGDYELRKAEEHRTKRREKEEDLLEALRLVVDDKSVS